MKPNNKVLFDIKLAQSKITIQVESLENNPTASNEAAIILYKQIQKILLNVPEAQLIEKNGLG